MALLVIVALLGCGRLVSGPVEMLAGADTREVILAPSPGVYRPGVQQLALNRRGGTSHWQLGDQDVRWGRVDVHTPHGTVRWVLLDLGAGAEEWEEQRFWLPLAVREQPPEHLVLAWSANDTPHRTTDAQSRRRDVLDTVEAHAAPGTLRGVFEIAASPEVSIVHGAWGMLHAGPNRIPGGEPRVIATCPGDCTGHAWSMAWNDGGLLWTFGGDASPAAPFRVRWSPEAGWVSPQPEAKE